MILPSRIIDLKRKGGNDMKSKRKIKTIYVNLGWASTIIPSATTLLAAFVAPLFNIIFPPPTPPTPPTIESSPIVVARKIGVRGNDGRVAFFNSCKGEIYLYKKFLDENYIGKPWDNKPNSAKLLGWKINIIANNPLHIDIWYESDNNFRCAVPYLDEKGIDYSNQISAYLIEGGILKVEFDFDSTPIDIYDLDKILAIPMYETR